MKKFIYIFIAIFLLLGIMETTHAADETYGDYTYKIENGYAVITGYKGAGGAITIPGSINGYTVKVIGEAAFWNNSNITKINMPNTVLKLEEDAFLYCNSLKKYQFQIIYKLWRMGYFMAARFWKRLHYHHQFWL